MFSRKFLLLVLSLIVGIVLPRLVVAQPTPSGATPTVNDLMEFYRAGTPMFAPIGALPIGGTKTINFTGTSVATLGSITGGSGYTPSSVIKALGTITAGTGYVPGNYTAVPLSGGTGTGITATIFVGPTGTVASVTLSGRGTGSTIGDVLSTSNANLGGSGSGFSIPIASTEYIGVPLTGGSGSGAIANIAVTSGGAVNAVALTNTGTGYAVSDTLSASAPSIGGSGSGFLIPVSAVGSGTSSTNSVINIVSSASGNCIDLTRCTVNLTQITDTVNNLSSTSMYHNYWNSTTTCTSCGTGRFFNQMTANIMGAGVVTPVSAQFTTFAPSMNLFTGLGGSVGATAGAVFAMNPQVSIGANATHINSANNTEFDLTVAAGVDYKTLLGAAFVLSINHRSAGTRENVAIFSASQGQITTLGGLVPPWDVFVQDGDFNGFPSNTTFFRCYPHAAASYGGSETCGASMATFADLSKYTSMSGNIILGPASTHFIDGGFNINAAGYSVGAAAGVTKTCGATIVVTGGIITSC